jgi:Tol biopolymer transport system component
MRADGTQLHAVPLPHSPAYYPSVSPDGTKLLYTTSFVPTSDGGNDTALYLFDFASQTALLVVSSFSMSYSALSPDLQTVAYSANYGLYAIGADGTNNRSLVVGSPGNGAYGHPTFASDSKTILYGTLGVVGSVESDGTNNQTLLTGVVGSFWYPNPAFSPDYSQIAVGIFCDQTSPFDLLVFQYASLAETACSSGTVLTTVSESSAENMGATDPSWGPTGLIAYGSYSDVWVIPATGGTPTNVTSKLTGDAGAFTASDPVWAPACAAVP